MKCLKITAFCMLVLVASATKLKFSGGEDRILLKTGGDIICPGSKWKCPAGTTCCPEGESGKFGCCTLRDAVCCSDHKHCCPHGYTCNLSSDTCDKPGSKSVKPVNKAKATDVLLRVSNIEDVICPDGKSHCPDSTTCCKMTTGQWGCCPLPKAVCCADKIHCCPQGTKCDVAHSKCTTNDLSLPWYEKFEAAVKLDDELTNVASASDVSSIVCPDGKSECPDGNTCCLMTTGEYGCCPLPKAVCCEDKEHCCPEGTTCDVAHQTCTSSFGNLPLFTKLTSEMSSHSVICPDQSVCPESTTCCMMTSGGYGCCPLPKAVCCKDKIHCCPEGTTCDLQHQTCTSRTESMSLITNPVNELSFNAVICPDGKSQCPDSTTCCILTTGQYGCCPLPKAVCCQDKEHCCPEGTTCDVTHQTCTSSYGNLPLFTKFVASLRTQSVICPDQSQCPDGTTCCIMTSGRYGCCPMPNAVCCSDKVHCCPEGTTCDLEHETCNSKDITVPLLVKTASKPPSNAIICPDEKSECPDQTTCCIMATGEYGCCPMPKAVCCKDKVHCCPEGTKCDVAHETCISRDSLKPLPMVKKINSKHTTL